MTLTHGMDTEAGRETGEQLSAGAQHLQDLADRLDGVIHGFYWTGDDADQTRDQWTHRERPQLIRASVHLHALAAQLAAEAEGQDLVSGSGAGGPTIGATGPLTQPDTGRVAPAPHGWLDSRISAFLAGAERFAESDRAWSHKLGEVLAGRADYPLSEIAAGALIAAGQGVGALVNAATGKDQHVFDESTGSVGTPARTPTDPADASTYRPVLTQPRNLGDLMQGTTDAYQVGAEPGSGGDVRITKVTNADGVEAYVVHIPGTEDWNPSATGYVRDLTGNLHLVGGNPTAAAETVREAMAAAGIPAGAPVMLVGHSQGGIIAGNLTSDPGFMRDYNVTNVLTYGAPIDHMRIDPSVNVLQVQHRLDLVPRLDLGGLDTDANCPDRQPTVTLDSPSVWNLAANHSHVAYINSVRDAIASGSVEGQQLLAWQNDPSLAPFLVGAEDSATGVDVPITRDDR